MKVKERLWPAALFLICLVYALFRFWKLTDSCLWFDEIFSVHAAEHSWPSLFSFVALDLIHPPLFYVLLKIWISIAGESLFWLRFFPVFFSILALIPFILFCRQLKFSSPTIAGAVTFLAFNGSLIKYSQEVRMYSLLFCLGLFSMWLFVRFLNTNKGFIALILVNILLVYTHYYGWLVVVSEVLAIWIIAREGIKKILLMFAVTALSFAPWAYAIWQATRLNAGFGQNLGWMNKPNPRTILEFIFDLFEPVYFQPSSVDPSAIYPVTVPLLLVILTAFAFWIFSLKKPEKEEKRNYILLLIFSFVPVLLAFAASLILPFSIWGTRHLIVSFAPFAILPALAFSKIQIRRLKYAGWGLVSLLFAAALLLQLQRVAPEYIWCAWEGFARDLNRKNSDEPVKIYVFEDLIAYHFWFALRDSDRQFQIIKVNGIEGLREDKAYFLPRGFNSVQTTDESAIEGEKFWIAFRDENWNPSKPPLQNLIARGYRIGEPKMFEAPGSKAFFVEIQMPETRPAAAAVDIKK